jgi:hypothetical protein
MIRLGEHIKLETASHMLRLPWQRAGILSLPSSLKSKIKVGLWDQYTVCVYFCLSVHVYAFYLLNQLA